MVRTLRVVKALTLLGAQRPGVPAGGLHFSCEKWRKEHQGSALDPYFKAARCSLALFWG